MLTQGSRQLEITGFDEFPQPIFVTSITYSGVGMTAGDHLRIDDLDGNAIVDQKIIAASENGSPFQQDPQWFNGLRASRMPGGTISVIIRFK